MNNIANNHHVIELANIAGFLDTLTTIMAELERCQKALNDYLEEKRNKFPRFYFLGDDDMLEILGQSQNPTIIQLHLKKLFSGIHSVVFADNHEKILAMRSHLKEEVRLSEEIEVSDVVENWLDELNKNMVTTLKLSTKKIKSTQIEESFNTYSSQIICLYN
jgi:dynein heavy chain 2